MKNSIKVFIIDDDLSIIRSFKRMIRSKYEDQVFWASDIVSAFLKIKELEPDLLITDINFSKSESDPKSEKYREDLTVGGVQLAREIRKLYPNLKIIASSGYRDNDKIFEKIIEKDWYDYFHTKGSDDLYEKYDEFRHKILSASSGLNGHLSKFFSPLKYGGDIHKSIYRMLKPDSERDMVLPDLPGIKAEYENFRHLLQSENEKYLDKMLTIYKERDFTSEERQQIKKRFTLNIRSLKHLENSERISIYAESFFMSDLWNKIISESERHSPDFSCSTEKADNGLYIKVTQKKPFDFDKFMVMGRTVYFYKQIINYGDIIITSGNRSLSVVRERSTDVIEPVDGTEIKMFIKTLKPE